MTKYIITTEQIEAIIHIGETGDTKGMIKLMDELKPIKPLSDDLIIEIFRTCHYGLIYPQDCTCGPRAMRITEGRAIEAHIAGK